MKLTHIALAVASLGVASANASSLPGLSAAPNNIPTTNQIFIAGSSSLSASVAGVVTNLCSVPATISSCGSAGVTVICNNGTANSGFSGVPFAVIKRDTDGSFVGVGNVINQTPITGWCDRVGTTPTNNTTRQIAPDAGLTDVDTNIWRGMFNTGALSIPILPPSVGVITHGGFAGQGFGIMVSEGMYRAMQDVQRTEGRLPASCTTAADPAFLPGAVPAQHQQGRVRGYC